MTAADVLPSARRLRAPLWTGLAGALAALALAELALGPVGIAPARTIAALLGGGDAVETTILWQIRIPRLVLGLAVGASLALAGAALQGMLRNPLADPGLVGVTSGASLGAVGAIVLGGAVVGALPPETRPFLLPGAAFAGACLTLLFVFAVARRAGEISVATLILAGVAINAIVGAALGAMVYVSDDDELRELTFWTLGALGSAGWPLVGAAAIVAMACAPVFLAHARALDLLQLGERAAFHAGLDVERCKLRLALCVALAVGAATAAAGPIGFIGLVAPHLARLLAGPSHSSVLPAAALIGAALVLAADLAVRLAVPPAEPPIGLATSLIGGPFFLWLLLRDLRGRRLA
ncbi:MAG: iron ABC transporter permease [Pseudomonadota bacterium]